METPSKAPRKPLAAPAADRQNPNPMPPTMKLQMTDPKAKAPEKPRVATLDANRLKEVEFERIVRGCYPPKEHTIEDLKRPEYWATVAPKLKPWDHIEVYAEDGTWYAELLVLAVERAHAVVHVLRHEILSTSDVAMTQLAGSSKYEIRHTPSLKWHLIRRSDGHIVKDGFQRREDAEFALGEHLKAVPA